MPPRRVAEKAKIVKTVPARKRGRPKSIGVSKFLLTESSQNLDLTAEITNTTSQEAIISGEKPEIPTIEVAVIDLKEEIPESKVLDKTIELVTTESPNLFVHVTNLVRPFTIVDLYALLATVGKFDQDLFWIDFIKSNCYVKFESLEIACAAIQHLNGTVWPDHNPKKLQANYADYEQMYVDTDGKLGTKESSQPQINSSKHIVPKIVIQPCEPEFETKPASQLAELFNKTACEPHIYWLSQSNDDPPAEECEITPLVSYDQKIESK